MIPSLLLAAVVLFLLGLQLSAFFSGSETGFYRVSFLRLSIDAQAGDRLAQRLVWFSRNPSYFVATTLVGNNVANYMVTVAIGLGIAGVYQEGPWWIEILGTLLVAPVIFIFGELLPKNLYYRSPMHLLRRGSWRFYVFYLAFLPISFPLIWLTRFLERFGGSEARPLELMLGRDRLVQVLSQGRREGLLTDVQGRLVNGVMYTAAQSVAGSVTPAGRVLGVDENVSRDELLDYARQFGLAAVAVRRAGTHDGWYGYVHVAEAAIKPASPRSLIRRMSRVDAATSRLEALLALRQAGATYGAVYRGEMLVGIVSERGLTEQLFRPPQTMATRIPVPHPV